MTALLIGLHTVHGFCYTVSSLLWTLVMKGVQFHSRVILPPHCTDATEGHLKPEAETRACSSETTPESFGDSDHGEFSLWPSYMRFCAV